MKKIIFKLTNCFQNAKFPFILAILNFLIIFLVLETTKTFDWSYRYKYLIWWVIPLFISIILILLTDKYTKKKYTLTISTIISTILVFIFFIYYITMLLFIYDEENEHPIKNIKYYKYYYNDYISDLFPEKIPENVQNVQFQYFPGMLQSGTHYGLYYVDKSMTQEQFDSIYSKKAQWIGKKEECNEKGLLTDAYRYTPVSGNKNDNFTIYLISGECDDSEYCNHGFYKFVAFNQKTKEITFRASIW